MGEWLDPLRSLIAIGLALLLVMLRLEAAQFSAAEYDESTDGRPPSFRRRMAWYGLGIGLILGILFVSRHPERQPEDAAAVPLDERAERLAVALAGTGQDGCCLGRVHLPSLDGV